MCVCTSDSAELHSCAEVKIAALARALQETVHFSQQDLDKHNARGLSDDSCNKVQDTYFKPTARRKTGDSVRARVRAQRLGAGERVRGGA